MPFQAGCRLLCGVLVLSCRVCRLTYACEVHKGFVLYVPCQSYFTNLLGSWLLCKGMPCPQAFVCSLCSQSLNLRTWGVISRFSLFANCKALASRDVELASAILDSLRKAQMANDCAGLSFGCCAQQLLHETSIHCVWASRVGAHDVGMNCVRGLTACKLSVAMDPSIWWQVSSNLRVLRDLKCLRLL